jgi:hypothetical protein
MKKKVINSLIAYFFILLNSNCYSQKITEIKIDFSNKTINDSVFLEKKIKEGNFYRLVIDNINLNLFRVQVNYSDTIYSKPLKTPTFDGLGLDAITKAISGLSDLSTSVTETKNDFNKSMGTLDAQMQAFHKLVEGDTSGYEKLKVRIYQENGNLNKIYNTVTDISSRIDTLKLSVYRFKLNSLKLEKSEKHFNLEKALKESLDIQKCIIQSKANSNELKNTFNSDYEKYSEDIRKKEDIKKAVSALNDAYDKLITVLDKTILEFNADNINKLLSQVVFMNNNSNNIYKSVPMQFNGEQAILEYKIIPRDENYLLQSYSAKILFPRRRPDSFSVGLSFYGSTLYDEAYSSNGTITVGTTKNDTLYSVIKEDVTKYEIGIVTLFRIRIGNRFGKLEKLDFHLNFGPGISISNNVKPRLLFGTGFSHGKRHRFAVDFGGIAGYVDRLSKAIILGKEYIPKPDNITVPKLELGAYLSLGYYYAF